MKKILTVVLAVLIATAPMFGCSGEDIKSQLSLNQTNVNMTLFGESELVVTYKNLDGVKWSNSNDSVVKLDGSGDNVKVIAVGSGISVVTVSAGELSDSCTISVNESNERLTLSTNGFDSVSLRENGTMFVPATVSFGNEVFTKATIKYTVEDQSVATIDDNGVITAVKEGTTKAFIRAEYYGVYSNVCTVDITVTKGPLLKINAAYVSLYAAGVGDDTTIFPNKFPINVSVIDGENSVENVSFAAVSSNDDVVKIKDGIIESVAAGNGYIEISYVHKNQTYTAKVFVEIKSIPIASLTLEEKSITLFNSAPTVDYKGQHQVGATATVDGKKVDASKLTWLVEEGEDVVTVTQKGLIKKLKAGQAKVSVNFSYGGKSYKDVCEVYVYEPINYLESHRFWDREGVYATVYNQTQFVYDEITLTHDKDVPFIRINLIPDKMLVHQYGWGSTPKNPDTYDNANVQFVFITLTEIGNETNKMTVGIRVCKDNWDGAIKNAQVGARSSTMPTVISGKNGSNHFFGINGDSNEKVNCHLFNGGGWAKTAKSSFYGNYLSDVTDTYTLGFSIEGTTIYMHNENTVVKLWDLNNDTLAFATANPEILSEEHVWSGFTSNKVKLSISADSYYTSSFNFAILDIGGRGVTSADVDNMRIATNA